MHLVVFLSLCLILIQAIGASPFCIVESPYTVHAHVKSARSCGTKHISKSEAQETDRVRAPLDVQMSFCVTRAMNSAVVKNKQNVKILEQFQLPPRLHFTKLHYTTLHYTTPSYIQLGCTTLDYATLHHITLHYTNYNYSYKYKYATLHYTTLDYIAPHYITLR